MTLTVLAIGGENYNSYASLAEANRELVVDPTRKAAWDALSDDDKAINLVAATHRLDVLRWAGERTGGATQATEWPREGLSYDDGTFVPSGIIPVALVRATALLAGTIAGDSSAAEHDTSATTPVITKVKAGSAEVTYASPTVAQKGAAPKVLQDETAHALIAQWLATAVSGAGAGESFGTDTKSAFGDYGLSGGYA